MWDGVAFALRGLQGGREPGGVRHAECIDAIATEAGDG